MPFLVIVSFLPLSLSVSCYPLAFSPFFSLWILHCSSLFSTISQNWVIDRLCGTILKNMGGEKKKKHVLAVRTIQGFFNKYPAYQIKLSKAH